MTMANDQGAAHDYADQQPGQPQIDLLDLPPELLQLVLPRVRMAPGHIPHAVCRAWRDALAPPDVAAEWAVHGLHGVHFRSAIVAAMGAVAGCSDHARGAAMVRHLLRHHVPAGEREEGSMADNFEEHHQRHRALAEGAYTAAAAGNSPMTLQLLALLPGSASDYCHAFMKAVGAGQLAVMSALKQHVDEDVCTDAVEAAAHAGHVPVLQQLLQWRQQEGLDMTGFFLDDALCSAAHAGQTATVALLLEQGAAASDGSALHAALRKKHWEVVRMLLPLVPPEAIPTAFWPSWESALEAAVRAGMVDMCSELLGKHQQVTVGHLAAAEKLPEGSQERADIMALLLPLAAASSKILVKTAGSGQLALMEALLQHGPAVDSLPHALQAAVSLDCMNDHPLEMVQRHVKTALLLIDAGAVGKPESEEMGTCLVSAARHGMTVVAARLLAAGVDPNAQGGAALRAAALGGHRQLCSILVAGGADREALTPDLLRAVDTVCMEAYQRLLGSGAVTSAAMVDAQARLAAKAAQVESMQQLLHSVLAAGEGVVWLEVGKV